MNGLFFKYHAPTPRSKIKSVRIESYIKRKCLEKSGKGKFFLHAVPFHRSDTIFNEGNHREFVFSGLLSKSSSREGGSRGKTSVLSRVLQAGKVNWKKGRLKGRGPLTLPTLSLHMPHSTLAVITEVNIPHNKIPFGVSRLDAVSM